MSLDCFDLLGFQGCQSIGVHVEVRSQALTACSGMCFAMSDGLYWILGCQSLVSKDNYSEWATAC